MEDIKPIKPTYLDDVEEARNRPDKSVLAIQTMCPEKLLVANVAFPEQVKHLWLNVRFDTSDFDLMFKYLMNVDCKCNAIDAPNCNKCSWYRKSKVNTICKDLVNFNQLETLTVTDLNLSSDLWTQFAQNSKCLREIEFTSDNCAAQPDDEFYFDDSSDHKEKGLEAILKIPTLKKASFLRLRLPFFPKGPSAIEHLELYVEPYIGCVDMPDEKYDYTNFSSHTNLKSIDISQGKNAPLSLHSLQLEKLINLEKLFFDGYFKGKEDIDSLKKVLDLPKINDVCIVLYKTKSYYIKISVTSENEKWIFETEDQKEVTVDSKEEVLKLIETFESTLTN